MAERHDSNQVPMPTKWPARQWMHFTLGLLIAVVILWAAIFVAMLVLDLLWRVLFW